MAPHVPFNGKHWQLEIAGYADGQAIGTDMILKYRIDLIQRDRPDLVFQILVPGEGRPISACCQMKLNSEASVESGRSHGHQDKPS